MSKLNGIVINKWNIFAHPVFLEQIEILIKEVEELSKKDPISFKKKNSTKRLAAISKLIFEIIPNDPTLTEYRQGNTLGNDYKHWYRAKFFQQYRLFFRYHKESKIIIYGWVNDEDTKRAYDSKSDAYSVFSKMLKNGQPPDNWTQLFTESSKKDSTERLDKLKG